MSRIQELVDELQRIHDGEAWHGPSLQRALTGVTAAQASSRPVPKAHSIWELVAHIAAWEDVWRLRLEGTRLDEPPAGDFPKTPDPTAEAWKQGIAHLHRAHEEFLRKIATLSEATLDQTVVGKPYLIRFMLEGAIRHHVYHAGQISLLKKSLEDGR